MKEHKVEKEVIYSLLILCLVIVSVLIGYALGNSKKDNISKEKNINQNVSYEKISDKEIENIINDGSYTSWLLNMQKNDVLDVKSFLEGDKYNDYIILKSYAIFTDWGTDISKKDVLKTAKKLFGYDLDLKFHDIYDGGDYELGGLIWNAKSENYAKEGEDAFAHGGNYLNEYHDYIVNILDIKNDSDNVYTVKTNQIWTEDGITYEGLNISFNYYATYEDAKDDRNAIFSFDSAGDSYFPEEAEQFFEENDFDYESYRKFLFDNTRGKLNTYEYKLAKEDGIIKILSYKKID